MRQELKNQEYFTNYFEVNKNILDNGFLKIRENRVNPEMISWYKKTMLDKLLYLTIADYTGGLTIGEMKRQLLDTVNYINEAWHQDIVRVEYRGTFLKQYHSTYDEMLWMLSIGYLLEISMDDFNKLVDVIDRDQVKDFLFEFIIQGKVKDREPIQSESYRQYFGVPKVFEKLRHAITETEKSKSEKLVKEFITKDWYKNHKDAGWYNSHKSKHDTYFGYWSFETAAVVKIMGLDDSSFRDCPYYPKDLV